MEDSHAAILAGLVRLGLVGPHESPPLEPLAGGVDDADQGQPPLRRHQREVGAGYFDEVSNVISGGNASTLALVGSTEEEQF